MSDPCERGRERGPDEGRPVVDTSISAEATAHTRPIFGKDYPSRTGTVHVRTSVVVECVCGNEVTVYGNQSVICQGGTEEEPCGREWRVK